MSYPFHMDPACQASAIFKYSYNCTETSNNGKVAASSDRKLKSPNTIKGIFSLDNGLCVFDLDFSEHAAEGADKTCRREGLVWSLSTLPGSVSSMIKSSGF